MKLLLCLYLSLLTFKNVSSRTCYASDMKAFMLGKPAAISVQECQSYFQELSKFEEFKETAESVASVPSPDCFVSTGVSENGKTTVIKGCGSCGTFGSILIEIVDRLNKPTADVRVTAPPPPPKFRSVLHCKECDGDECNSYSGATKEKLFVFNIVLLLFVFLLI